MWLYKAHCSSYCAQSLLSCSWRQVMWRQSTSNSVSFYFDKCGKFELVARLGFVVEIKSSSIFLWFNSGSLQYVRMSYRRCLFFVPPALCQNRATTCFGIYLAGCCVFFFGPIHLPAYFVSSSGAFSVPSFDAFDNVRCPMFFSRSPGLLFSSIVACFVAYPSRLFSPLSLYWA